MKIYNKISVALLLLIGLNNYAQTLHYLENPTNSIKREQESVSKVNILFENLSESSPDLILDKLKFYGIDAKKQKIKTIKSKNSYFKFDSAGNLIYADFGGRIGKAYNTFVEFKYDNFGRLVRFKGSTYLGSGDPSIKDFIYDSLSRIIRVEETSIISNFKVSTEYKYDERNNVIKSVTYYNEVLSPKQDSVRKAEEESLKKFFHSSLGDTSHVKKEMTEKQAKNAANRGNFHYYDSANRIIKSVSNGQTVDSLFHYKDSVVRYKYYEGYRSVAQGYMPPSIDKWINFIEKGNVVKITKGNDLQMSRKFDGNNNVAEETWLYYNNTMLSSIAKKELKYDAKGRLAFLKMESKPHYPGHAIWLNQQFFYNDEGMLISYEHETTYEDKAAAKAYGRKKKMYEVKYKYYQ